MNTRKLFERITSSPSASLAFRDFERVLVAFGFQLERTRGSHRAYAHGKVPRPLIVQPRGKDAKSYQVREFLDMVEAYGLELSE